jgi:hypothetical protein
MKYASTDFIFIDLIFLYSSRDVIFKPLYVTSVLVGLTFHGLVLHVQKICDIRTPAVIYF